MWWQRGYFKEMTEKLRKELIAKKKKEVIAKFNSARENFEKKEKEMRTALKEASKIWAELSERFIWWQSLP
jgi:phenylalanyl-tRNA synthetase alpha subunit